MVMREEYERLAKRSSDRDAMDFAVARSRLASVAALLSCGSLVALVEFGAKARSDRAGRACILTGEHAYI